MYALIKNGVVSKFPYWPSDLRYENPDISFPSVLSNSLLETFGVLPVAAIEAPSVDYTKTVVNARPEFRNGIWTQVWNVVDASAEEIEQRTLEKAKAVRADRNALLTASDWTQVADAPVDRVAWATYRQALRDITSQTGFPFDVQWPQEPN